jgi:hypothetical protein
MKRSVYLLLGVTLLYVLPSLALKAVYGPSHVFPPSEDCWTPDGNGGWIEHGSPLGEQPAVPSVEVPMALQYVPLFLPAVLLIMFLFGPWKRYMRDPSPPEEGEEGESDKPDS